LHDFENQENSSNWDWDHENKQGDTGIGLSHLFYEISFNGREQTRPGEKNAEKKHKKIDADSDGLSFSR
jgi:hypothetical protein